MKRKLRLFGHVCRMNGNNWSKNWLVPTSDKSQGHQDQDESTRFRFRIISYVTNRFSNNNEVLLSGLHIEDFFGRCRFVSFYLY